MSDSEGTSTFKPKKNRNLRQRKVSSDEEKDDSDEQVNEEIL